MSPNEDEETNHLSSNNIEHEDRVKIEEASVNLSSVKKELEEFEFTENQYRIALTYETIFGETSNERRANVDSLIGFLDDDVIMENETATIKLEEVKDENKVLLRKIIEQSHCNKCGGNYEGYCPDCSSLSHILNNITPNINPEPDLNTAPINMLEIREVSTRPSVFALKTLSKGIILGPFEGVAPIESTTGLQWKTKDEKLITDENGNWIKYIESVTNQALKNLNIFQYNGILYFETIREIQEGEELLVCYCEEKEVLKLEKEGESYLVPEIREEYPKVFACTLCCLGFQLESCLVEHKRKCPKGDHGANMEDFEIIQCRCCKIWLEKQEHLDSHMMHCLNNYNKSCRNRNISDFPPIYTDKVENVNENDETATSIDVDASYSTPPTEIIDANNSLSPTYFKVHKDFHDGNIITTHPNTSEKTYKCSACSYQTKYKSNLKPHLRKHTDVKHFQCDICKKRFSHKCNLKVHIKDKHSNTNEKDYKCSKCSYRTNRKGNLKIHLVRHNDINSFQCHICKQTFVQKENLNAHIKHIHSNTKEREYKCSECSFQTNYKSNLKIHLDRHNDIKSFQCGTCKQGFNQKNSLILHIKNKHSNTNEKEYKCSECSYQTNLKCNLKQHLGTHNDIKRFQCDICKKRFAQISNLNRHIKTIHSNSSEKEHKCSKCSYQTKRKSNLKLHLNTHMDIKPFECGICKQRFNQKGNLKGHIRNKHSNTNEKESF